MEKMCTPTTTLACVSRASDEAISKIKLLEDEIRKHPQTPFVTEHVFHAGLYARTVRIPAMTLFTTVLIKRATILIVNGRFRTWINGKWMISEGYQVVPADAGRKQIYATGSEVSVTMVFPTESRTVEEAEAEFTEESESLLSRTMENDIVMTEAACLESQHQPLS